MFKIFDGRDCFYQWDINQRLLVEDETIQEVHFCNKTDDEALVCEVYTEDGKRVVNVPNILLQDNWDICIYAFCGYTKYSSRFKIKARSKPADYVYTETEVKSVEKVVAEALAEAKENGEFIPDLVYHSEKADRDRKDNIIDETYATKDENKQNIKSLVKGNYYNKGDYVLAKGSVSGVTMSLICKCKNAHTSNGSIGSANWDIVERITAENAINDEKGNNIIGTYAPLAMMSNFKLTKLEPNGVFTIKPNMLIMAMAEDGEKCIKHYANDGNGGEYVRATNANMLLCFSVASSKDIEGDNYSSSKIRVSCLYYENALNFGTKNSYLWQPAVKNTSSDKSVYIYYIEQGGNK